MKLCINCYTLNAQDEVFCSRCGMSLINVPTGEAALKLGKAWEADHAEEARAADTAETPSDERDRRGPDPLRTALGTGGGLLLCLLELILEYPELQPMALILFGIVLTGLAAVGIWQGAMTLGARLADRWLEEDGWMIDTRRGGVELPQAQNAGTDLQRANLAGANPDTATVTPDRSK